MTASTLPIELKQKKYNVTVEYCVPCDYHAEALRVAEEVLGAYQHIIDKFVFITGSKGVFEVKVDNEPIFSKKALKRHPKPGEVLQSFKGVVGAKVATYPS